MKFYLQTAGLHISVESIFDNVSQHCCEYLCDADENLDISVRTDYDMLRAEFDAMLAQMHYAPSPQEIEILVVHRLICDAALDFGLFMMHGAAIAVNNGAYLFIAKSGTGKTTHIRLWLKNLPDAFAVNGDKPLIKVTDSEVLACGTPWSGKERMNTNTMVPLRAIILMERSEDNSMEQVSFSQAFPMLLQQTYRPADADKMRKTLSLLSQLQGRVEFYRFRFNNMKDDAFDIAYRALVHE